MPNYSKAARGLFVQVGLGRVFTAIAISPSEPSRQLLARDTFRARLNLPDKELRSFRFKYFINIFTFACYLFKKRICTFTNSSCLHEVRTISFPNSF